MHQVAGASGLAFRTSLDAQVTLAGPHAYPWREELPAAAERLGYLTHVVACNEPPTSTLHAAARARALVLIADGLAADRPTMVWGVHAPEFGLVRGLDGEVLEVSGILDGLAPPELDAAQLGHGDVPVLFALQLTLAAPISDEQSALAGLRAALTHGRGPAATLSGFATGLGAWRLLLAALESGHLDPAGLAYAAQRYAEARAAAAGWLEHAESALGVDLRAARAAFRRSAGMLAELAACHPFPPPPDLLLTNSARDQAHALVEEVAAAEAGGLDGIEAALAAHERRRASRLRVSDLDEAQLPSLFACVADLPVALDDQAATCRDQLRPQLGSGFRGKLLYDGELLVGHLLYAPLADAHYPVYAEGNRWFVFCPWRARDRRGQGLGARLFAALDADARAAGIDGLLTLATTDERFLYPSGLERHGFTERGRRGELLLWERSYTAVSSNARIWDPAEAAHEGALPVTIRHGYNCPLLLRTRTDLEHLARTAGTTVTLDVAPASARQPAGATIAGKPLLHGFVPLAALTAALKSETEKWDYTTAHKKNLR